MALARIPDRDPLPEIELTKMRRRHVRKVVPSVVSLEHISPATAAAQ